MPGKIEIGATALVGAIAGAVGGAAWMASQRFHEQQEAARSIASPADIALAEKLQTPTQADTRED